MERENVTLHVVEWTGTKPNIVTAEGTRQGKVYRFNKRSGLAFKCRIMMFVDEAEQMCIGENAVDATYLEMQKHLEEEKRLEERLVDVRRKITELAVLGLAESGV